MPLRHRILATPATVQDFALAAEEKYQEGAELFVSGRRGAGIYLHGYVVEMILKNACFLVDGARPSDFVEPRLGPIRRWAKTRFPKVPHESFHGLWFWVLVLRRKRALAGRPLPISFDASLIQRVRRLHGIWIVEMRYKPDQSLQREAETVYDDVTWIRDHQAQMVY